jgi:hypothetical protein
MGTRILVAVAVLAGLARADTLDVPGQYPTIQAAIAAAHAGDTIVVQPGTYPEALVLPAFSFSLLAPGGADVTVIDASGAEASVIRSFGSGTHLVEGFTLTGGHGTPDELGQTFGGGVYSAFSPGLTLRACNIRENRARIGGGVYGRGTLEDCEIVGNQGSDGGGGVYSTFGGMRLVGCVVRENRATNGSGGGLQGQFELEDTLVVGNSASVFGGGLYGSLTGQPWTRVTFAGNSAESGGGCYLFGTSTAVLTGTTFIGNTALASGGSVALATCSTGIPSVIRSCVFIGNSTAGTPFSLLPSQCVPAAARLEGCTFLGEMLAGALTLEGCIVRGLPAPIVSADAVSFSDVEGGWPGPGNIDADPLFADVAAGDVHLLAASPCRNAGNPSPSLPEGALDVDGEPRVLEGRPDMGADEFADDCNGNSVPDWQDLLAGTSFDCEADGLPDECQPFVDCNGNGVRDGCDIAAGVSTDCNSNGVPDECEPQDCNGNGVFDACESGDCNGNGIIDVCDIVAGTSPDVDGNGVPDECHQILHVPADQPTLAAAVAVALPGDTILLTPGVYSGDGNHGVLITKPLMLAGDGDAAACVLDAQGAERILSVEGVHLTLRDLTLRGGDAGMPGGGALLLQAAATATIRDCVFTANTAPGQAGGALRVRGGSAVNLTGCLLFGNSAVFGGAISVQGGSLSLAHCTLFGNTATGSAGGSSGGALRAVQGAAVALRDSILRGSTASTGAELSLVDAATVVTVDWCDIEGGEAGAQVTPGASLLWGAGNIDADALFKAPADGDFRLSGGSPCIDSADPLGAADADGTPPDIGALPFSPFEDLGHALAGALGPPQLAGAGTAIAGDPLTLTLTGAAAQAGATLVVGASTLFAPFKGGVMVPEVDLVIGPLVTGPDGSLQLAAGWPVGIPSGTDFYAQAWVPDAGGPAGLAASNGLAIEAR